MDQRDKILKKCLICSCKYWGQITPLCNLESLPSHIGQVTYIQHMTAEYHWQCKILFSFLYFPAPSFTRGFHGFKAGRGENESVRPSAEGLSCRKSELSCWLQGNSICFT